MPTVDFTATCIYTNGNELYAHRNLCPPRLSGAELAGWSVRFERALTGETTWEVYLSPTSSASPYGVNVATAEPRLFRLLKQWWYHIIH